MQIILILLQLFAISTTTFSLGHQKCQSSTTVPANRRHLYDRLDKFTRADVRLHIFPRLRIACDGFLTSWRFLTARTQRHRSSSVHGLHLAVFRETLPRLYSLVAETHINNFNNAGNNNHDNSDKTWITFVTQPALIVQAGDVLGFYYDSLDEIYPALLTSPDLGGQMADAFIAEKSHPDLALDTTVDVSGTGRSSSFPALIAVIDETPENKEQRPMTTPKASAYPKSASKMNWETPVLEPIMNVRSVVLSAKCLNPPAQTKFCQELTLRAFFDYSRGGCRSFFGCHSDDPDANNFPSIQSCQSFCVNQANGVVNDPLPLNLDAHLPPVEKPLRDPVCSMSPAHAVFCFGASFRYYFDPRSSQCLSYFGCPIADSNNFASMENCMEKCSRDNSFTIILPGATRGESSKPPSIQLAIDEGNQPVYLRTGNYEPNIRVEPVHENSRRRLKSAAAVAPKAPSLNKAQNSAENPDKRHPVFPYSMVHEFVNPVKQFVSNAMLSAFPSPIPPFNSFAANGQNLLGYKNRKQSPIRRWPF